MADDVSAGRLYLDAVADTSGFARDAKAKIDAEVKNLRAKIKAELDDRGLIGQARAAADKASKAARVRLQADIDSRGLVAQIRRAATDASKAAAAKAKIGLQVDQAKFQRDLAAAVAAMDGAYSVTVGVDVDTTGAAARLAAFRASQRMLPLDLGVNINTGNLGTVLTQFAKFPALAGGVFLLGSAVAQLGGGLIAMASSAASAVGVLAALPGLVTTLAAGIGTLVAGFSGIGGGIAALGEADAASAQQTQKAATIRTDSARAVADAQRNLKDAYHQAADAARQAGYAVQDAEWGLARAHEAAREAQENLNEARRAARDYLDDLNDSLERAALTEETAANNLAKAKQALQDVMWDASSTGQEQRDAALAVKQAQQDLKDAKDQHGELRDEAEKANREGVRGSEQVEQARDSLRDANHQVMLSERQLFEARHAAADTARQNAQMIADAQQAITDAQAGGAQAIAAQNMALAGQTSEFDKLNPAAQRFARFLFDTVMPRFDTLRDKVQATLLPPIQRGIQAAMPWIDTLETGLIGTAEALGETAVEAGNLFGSKGFNRDTAAMMDSNNRSLRLFGSAGVDLIAILTRVARVAGPTLIEPFARWVKELTRGWRATLLTRDGTEGMRKRFVAARESAKLLASIIGNVTGALFGVGEAAKPAGDDLLGTLDRVTERWNKWANSDVGQQRMREFFEQTKPATEEVGRLLVNVVELVGRMGEAGGGPLVGALKALNGIVTGLNAVLATPYLGTFVGWLLTLAGVAGGLGMVAGMMVKMGNSIALLAKVSGLTRLWNLFKGTLLATRIQYGLLIAQQKIAAAGMAVWNGIVTAATFLMGKLRIAASLMFGPWGIALLAVVGLFVLLYKKVDWFRAAVQWVMGKVVDAFNWVKDAAVALWDELFGHSVFPDIMDGLRAFWGVVETIFGYVVKGIKVLGSVFSWLWNNAVKPAWSAIQKAVSLAWNYYYKPILSLLWKALQTAGKVALWLWRNAIVPAWKGIQTAIRVAWPIVKRIFGLIRAGLSALGDVFRWLWKNIVQPVWRGIEKIIRLAWAGIKVYFRAVRAYVNLLGDVFRWLWKNVVQPVWRSIQTAIKFAWNNVIKPAFTALRKGLDLVGDGMSWLWNRVVKPVWNGIKDSIDTVWGFLRDKVFDPLMDVVKNDIPNAFEAAKNGIDTMWSKLRNIAAAPVDFIVNTVYTKGIKAVVDKIPGVPDLPSVSFNYAKGTSSVLPGYTPGRDPHNFVSTDGKMGLNLSGGEGILRPEVVRAMGARTIDTVNAAARKGGTALKRALLSTNPDGTVNHSRANGGLIPAAVRKTASFFLGGVLPVAGASANRHETGYPNYPYAGDLNYGSGYDDYGRAVRAWKGGTARTFDMGDDSYGRGVTIDHGSAGSTLYAHLSSMVSGINGAVVRAGQKIGAVGDYGNTGTPPTSHLHFEVRSGAIDLGDAAGSSGPSAAEVKAREEKDGWMDLVGSIKDAITSFPSMLGNLSDRGGWGDMLVTSVKSLGDNVAQWINDKIPNEISIPGPNIPLPDNPIPDLFDRGGDWRTGRLGANLSGSTETVFTNENIVDLTSDLARIASGLRAQTVDGGGSGPAAGLHIDKLELSAPPDKVQQVLGDLHHSLRILSLGGVHAKRAAGAPV